MLKQDRLLDPAQNVTGVEQIYGMAERNPKDRTRIGNG